MGGVGLAAQNLFQYLYVVQWAYGIAISIFHNALAPPPQELCPFVVELCDTFDEFVP